MPGIRLFVVEHFAQAAFADVQYARLRKRKKRMQHQKNNNEKYLSAEWHNVNDNYMLSGAETPRIKQPFAITCFVTEASSNLAVSISFQLPTMRHCW